MDVMVTLSKKDTPYLARVVSVYYRNGVKYFLTIDQQEFTVSVTADKIKEL